MTLHIYEELEQGTDEWHTARRGIITASVAGRLLTPTLKPADNDASRGLIATLAAERITGWTDDTPMTSDMWRGVISEPYARDLYTEHHAPVTECGFMRRDETTWRLGYSPDGLVGDDGLIEIKAPRAKTHLTTILSGQVPRHYMAQCQTGLLVSGRAWIDFVSFYGGMPLWVRRVTPDPDWFEAIEAAVVKAETDIAHLVDTYRDRVEGLPMTDRIPDENEIKVA